MNYIYLALACLVIALICTGVFIAIVLHCVNKIEDRDEN